MSKPNIIFHDEVDESAGIFLDETSKRTILINEFDLNKMRPTHPGEKEAGVRIVIIGHPGTGKSRLIESILAYKGWIAPVSQIYHSNEPINHFYGKRTTDVTIHHELDNKNMENFIKRQQIALQYLENPWSFLILDDVTDDPTILSRHPFLALYKRGRHFQMIKMLALQYPMDIKPGMRSCVDYVFIMANGILNERKKLYENFASGSIPTFADFCDILDGVTGDHTALVIDNTTHSSNISDRVFYFKANLDKIPSNFRIGAEDAYKHQAQRLDPNYTPMSI
jgi:hypothetical protein